jgi:phosphatidate cytidylyltransferase
MLKQRILTAIVLLAFLVPAVIADDPRAFVLLSAVLIGAAGWEWSRLCGWSPWACLLTGVLGLLACLLFWLSAGAAQPLPLVWLVMSMVWVLTAAALLKGGVPLWLKVPAFIRWLTGIIVLFAAWLALVQARAMGINFLFSIFFLGFLGFFSSSESVELESLLLSASWGSLGSPNVNTSISSAIFTFLLSVFLFFFLI